MGDEIVIAAVIVSLGVMCSALILNGQRAVRREITGLRGEIAGLRGEIAGLRGETAGLRSDHLQVRSELAQLREFVMPLKGLREAGSTPALWVSVFFTLPPSHTRGKLIDTKRKVRQELGVYPG